ncbi:MAG: hypothetical protein QXX30_02045 [Candidatus Aenigmatarchaeota archaeon]
MIVFLNEYDVRYLFSCIEDEINVFKNLADFRSYLEKNGTFLEKMIEIEWKKIGSLFPNLSRFFISRYKNDLYLPSGSISRYFEGKDEFSHNKLIINKILKLRFGLKSLSDCLVFVGRKEGEIYHFYTLFGDVFEEQVYFGYFTPSEIEEKDKGEYFTVHRRKYGKRIAIRIIDENKAKEMIEYLYSFNIQK